MGLAESVLLALQKPESATDGDDAKESTPQPRPVSGSDRVAGSLIKAMKDGDDAAAARHIKALIKLVNLEE